MSKNIEACDLCEANGTAQEGLVEFIRDQLVDDFIASTIDCMVFIKQMNFVLVCSDDFGKIAAIVAGSGMTR